MKILFPGVAGKLPKKNMLDRYYAVYYRFIHNIFSYMGANIVITGDTSVADGAFIVELNGKRMVVDYSDHLRDGSHRFKYDTIKENGTPIMKFHYSENVHENWKDYFPFSPVSFYDWEEFFRLANEIKYSAEGPILSRQKPYGNARQRRNFVQMQLHRYFGAKVETRQIAQDLFWKGVSNCSVAVFVPGCREDMLDRGPLQYIALGCCIISPYIITLLPFKKTLVPNEHYIQCADDYSDIAEKVKWAEDNKDKCKEIGKNAQALFMEACTPEPLINWVEECLGNY